MTTVTRATDAGTPFIRRQEIKTYKNMPLDSYEQSWTVRALCTEKRQYKAIFTINNVFTRWGRQTITYNRKTRNTSYIADLIQIFARKT